MRQLLFMGLLATLLSACGTDGTEESPFAQVATKLAGQPSVAPRAARLLRRNPEQMQVGFIRKKRSGIVLLELRKGPYEYWLGGDDTQIILQDGMLHGTRGLGEGLLASELSQPLALVRGLAPGVSDRFHTYLDGNDHAVTRTYRCVIGVEPAAPLSPERPGLVHLVREDCKSLDQAFTNVYWVDPKSRKILQSRQWVGPRIGSISTRVIN